MCWGLKDTYKKNGKGKRSIMAREDHDNENIWRCPILGGPVPFKYCRTTNNGLSCAKIPDCWHGKFDAIQFLKDNYSDEELKTIFSPQPGKMERIFGVLERLSDEKKKQGDSK
jgi:hypothetical protein